MKRSEMIEKLTLPLSLIGGGMYTSKELDELASHLLRMIEKEGMLPPQSYEMRFVNQVYDPEPLTGHRWEPEEI